MKISIIYAQNQQGAIGYKGNYPLPWHHQQDLERFRKLTMNRPIVMGMDTFNAIGQPLPGRFTYVITKKRGLVALGRLDSVQFVPSVESAIHKASVTGEKELFIVGGAGIINDAIDSSIATTIYRTIVKSDTLEGNLALVLRPEDKDPVWDAYGLADEVVVNDTLTFQTYEKKQG